MAEPRRQHWQNGGSHSSTSNRPDIAGASPRPDGPPGGGRRGNVRAGIARCLALATVVGASVLRL